MALDARDLFLRLFRLCSCLSVGVSMSILQPLLLFGVGRVVARGLKTRRCRLGCEGIVSKRLGSIYRRGRSPPWIKVKNPKRCDLLATLA